MSEKNEEIIEDVVEEITEETISGPTENIEDAEIVEEVIESNEEKLERENKELKDKVIRAAAEFDNFRKRTTKEKLSIYSDGVKETCEKLLPIIDNFERAMNSNGVNKEDSFYIGMDMIYKQFISLLTDLGIKELGAVGEEFDPNFHFAVAKEDNADFEENQIIEILQKGYILKEKVIRPAMVKVAE